MKKSERFFLGLSLFLLSSLPGFGQVDTGFSPGSLEGRWEMDAEKVLGDMERSTRAVYDTLPSPQRERFGQSLKARVFEFGEGGDFSARWEAHGKRLSANGRWELKGGGNLAIVFPSGISEYRVIGLSGDRLELKPLNESRGMIQTLFFTKTKGQ